MILEQYLPIIIGTIFYISTYLIVTLSLNLEAGYAGIPDFGKMMFVAVGAYVTLNLVPRVTGYLLGVDTTGLTDSNKNIRIMEEINKKLVGRYDVAAVTFIVSIVLAMGAGAIFGYLASRPAIRLRGDFLAISLLAIAEIVRQMGIHTDFIAGGEMGLYAPNIFFWYRHDVVVALLSLTLAVATFLLLERMANSPLGRLLRAIRDDEDAAKALGKDVTKIRTRIIMLSSAIAALVGVLAVYYSLGGTAKDFDRVTWTFWPWAMMIAGGMANNVGVLVGTLLIVIPHQLIFMYKHAIASYVPFDPAWLEKILVGMVVIIILYVRPQGLVPEKPSRTINYVRVRDFLEQAEKK